MTARPGMTPRALACLAAMDAICALPDEHRAKAVLLAALSVAEAAESWTDTGRRISGPAARDLDSALEDWKEALR